jgi:hypothetical protein
VPHIQNHVCRFADDRKCFGQELIERFTLFEAFFEFGCLGLEFVVGKIGKFAVLIR